MSQETPNGQRRVARAIAQRLEGLQAAGVTHIRRVVKITLPENASGREEPGRRPSSLPRLPGQPTREAVALAEVAQRVAACTRCDCVGPQPDANGLRRWRPTRPTGLSGRGAGGRRRSPGGTFRGPGRPVAHRHHRQRHEAPPRRRVHHEHPALPAAGQPHATLPVEAAACREYLDAQLAIIQPEYICCLGACAAQNLLGTDTAIGKLRGRFHDFQRHQGPLHLSPGLRPAQSASQAPGVGRYPNPHGGNGDAEVNFGAINAS